MLASSPAQTVHSPDMRLLTNIQTTFHSPDNSKCLLVGLRPDLHNCLGRNTFLDADFTQTGSCGCDTGRPVPQKPSEAAAASSTPVVSTYPASCSILQQTF
ncbi:Nf-Kappa-B-Repressing Factor [Manis pentadactyla]|nr:Nf-Kappa-B-Repressing Factor [Manis pentadactyla]